MVLQIWLPFLRETILGILQVQIRQRSTFPDLAIEQLPTILGWTVHPADARLVVLKRLHISAEAFVAPRPNPVRLQDLHLDTVRPDPLTHQIEDGSYFLLVLGRPVVDRKPQAAVGLPEDRGQTRMAMEEKA